MDRMRAWSSTSVRGAGGGGELFFSLSVIWVWNKCRNGRKWHWALYMLHAHLLLSVLFISNNDLNLTENRWWLINMQLVKWRHLLWERLPCSPYISMSPWLTVFWIAFQRIWIQVSTWFNSSLFILPLGSFPPSFCMFIAVSTLVIFTPTCDIRNITIKLGLKSRKPRMKHTTDPHVPVCSKYLQKRTSLCWADMRFPWLWW